jgi:uncharacterized protein YqjF (DUF2071 family)
LFGASASPAFTLSPIHPYPKYKGVLELAAMNSRTPAFLTAEWRHLAMLNFEIDPASLRPLVPAGTELDDWRGKTLVSLVGFLFLDTRVMGIAIPGHCNFEEVNLRFYVRRRAGGGWRRAVAFVKEIVPRPAIAWTARALYGEDYVALPMRHHIERDAGSAAGRRTVTYAWQFRGQENTMELSAHGDAAPSAEGSEAEFITEHYWGYARRRGGHTTEYRVEHPRWRVSMATAARLDCDAAGLYGPAFVEALQSPPVSAFLVEGSNVTVFGGTRLRD